MTARAFHRVAVGLTLTCIALSRPVAEEVPTLTGRVVDNAGIISPDAEATLTRYFSAVEQRSGAQIAILTVASLGGAAIESYSIQVTEAWRLGRAGEDDGVLILVSTQDRRIRIEVGFGLEGRLTDAAAGFIIREYMQPAFSAGEFDRGFLAAAQAVGSAIAGVDEIAGVDTAPRASTGAGRPQFGSAARGVPLNLIVLLLVFGLGTIGRAGRYRRRGGLVSGLFWGSVAGSAMRGRSYHHGGFSGGGFGGFSGGGFGGGGGGFGGGGASGGW